MLIRYKHMYTVYTHPRACAHTPVHTLTHSWKPTIKAVVYKLKCLNIRQRVATKTLFHYILYINEDVKELMHTTDAATFLTISWCGLEVRALGYWLQWIQMVDQSWHDGMCFCSKASRGSAGFYYSIQSPQLEQIIILPFTEATYKLFTIL